MKQLKSSSTLKCRITTDVFAAANFVKPQSVRKRWSETGSYHGVIPEKLKNGRLAWPNENDDQAVNGGE